MGRCTGTRVGRSVVHGPSRGPRRAGKPGRRPMRGRDARPSQDNAPTTVPGRLTAARGHDPGGWVLHTATRLSVCLSATRVTRHVTPSADYQSTHTLNARSHAAARSVNGASPPLTSNRQRHRGDLPTDGGRPPATTERLVGNVGDNSVGSPDKKTRRAQRDRMNERAVDTSRDLVTLTFDLLTLNNCPLRVRSFRISTVRRQCR